MLTVYLTGSRGYIGSYLLKYLEKQNITVIENHCDIRNYELLLNELQIAKADVVIHLAACATVEKCQKDYQLALSTNITGTKNLVKAMRIVNCNKIIYASTCAVYGNKNYKVCENDNLLPLSHYGYTKLLGEHVIDNENLNSVIFRMTNVCGFNQYLTSKRFLLFDTLLEKTKNNEQFYIFGNNYPTLDGTCSRDYISLNDTCRAYYLAIMKLQYNVLKGKHVFNLSSNRNYTVKQITYAWQEQLQNLNKESGKQLSLNVLKTYARKGDVTNISLNNYKVSNTLYWRAEKSLDDIVSTYINEL